MSIKTIISYETVTVCPNQEKHVKELTAKIKAKPSGIFPLEDYFRTYNFCNECGAKYINKRIKNTKTVCSKCGKPVYSYDTYCPNCGDKLSG